MLLGDPWSYHTQVADREGEEVRHELTDEDKVVIQHVLQRSAKERFPRLRAILLWNVSFKEEKNRTDREIKSVCEELKRKRASVLLFFPLVNLTDVPSTLSFAFPKDGWMVGGALA